jgi:prepilin signal peptidase PulO-like enzyme (type II secretory pathway)
VRYLAVELLTAGLFALVAVVSLSLIDLAFLWLVVTLLLLIFVYDIRHLIIPDELTVALTALVSVRYGIGLFLGEVTWLEAVVAGLASLLSASFFFGLWWFSRGRWIGFGDVKLAVPLALLVGSSGAFSLVVLSFWIGAVVTLLWLAILWLLVRIGGQARLPNTARSLTMKSAVPFAPFLIASAILVYFGQVDVLAFFTYEF